MSSLTSSLNSLGALSIIAVIGAIVATVLAFVFIIPEKKFASLNKFGKFLHKTLNFKYLIIEKILQAIYIYSTAFIILCGFFMLFIVIPGYSYYGYSSSGTWMGGYGLLIMILGPIVIRIIYEFMMMAILLVKNVIAINNKLKDQTPGTKENDYFATPDISELKSAFKPAAPAAPVTAPVAPDAPVATAAPAVEPEAPAPESQPRFCTKCGAPLDANGKCPNCDQ